MSKNIKSNDLRVAKKNKNDEFFTQMTDIEDEIKNYKDNFKGKTVYCNCDDPYVSNFFTYFTENFEELGLKKLIVSGYRNDDSVLRTEGTLDNAIWLEYSGEYNTTGITPTLDNLTVHKFEGDGDFRSDESIELLKEADIVVTNPPFSLFRDYIAQLIEYDKDFLIIGNMNSVTYKDVFPLIVKGLMWYGQSIKSGDRLFQVPKTYPMTAASSHIDDDDNRFVRVKGVRWFTNMDYNERYKDIVLTRTYDPEIYPYYDDYDAINIDKVVGIPNDFTGVMGVPITFIDKYNPHQFEIIGIDRYVEDNPYFGRRFMLHGKEKYARILIKHKKLKKIGK